MNVVLITTDQQRKDTISSYGAPVCSTPNIDRIASRGVRFDRAYTQHPYCQPARASILSGLMPSTHGVWNNGVDIPGDLIPYMLSSRLSGAGWNTGFCGKGHFSSYITFQPTDRAENLAGSEAYDPASWDGPYMGFDWNRIVIGGHYPTTMISPPRGLHYAAHVFEDGQQRGNELASLMGPEANTNPAITAPQTWNQAVPYEYHQTHFTGEAAVEFIKGQRDSGRPFFLWASFADPHHPLDPPAPFAGTYDPADVVLGDLPTDDEIKRMPASHRAWVAAGGFPDSFNPGWVGLPESERRQMIAAYYDMIAACDHEIGRILDALAETGAEDETLVIFTVDHGELLGDHGMIFKGPFHYEGLINIPLIIGGPGIAETGGGRSTSALAGTVDLAPTIAELAGITAEPGAGDPGFDGVSLAAELSGDGSTGAAREHVVTENDHHQSNWKEFLRTVTVAGAKLTMPIEVSLPPEFGEGAGGELYDLDEDPGERVNRWDDPEYAPLKSEMLDLAAEVVNENPRREPIIGFA